MVTNIEIVNKNNKNVLETLLQLFLHDISLYFPMEFESNTALYKYDSLDKYFNNNNNFPYFIKVNGNIAGFILVLTDENNNLVIQEMFVLNNYKGKGVGFAALSELLNIHKASWIVRSLPCSTRSEHFWIKSIGKLLNNKYEIEHIGNYNRAVLTFSNK